MVWVGFGVGLGLGVVWVGVWGLGFGVWGEYPSDNRMHVPPLNICPYNKMHGDKYLSLEKNVGSI